MSSVSTLQATLSQPGILVSWLLLVGASLVVVVHDLWTMNRTLGTLMKVVWTLTVAYSGPIGLAVYWYAGRRQIRRDSIWRRGFRSVAHCYSGCGLGEMLGLVIAVGVLSAGNLVTAAVTFVFAYLFGFALTFGPMLRAGSTAKTAALDAIYTETGSIVAMEIVAISVDIYLAGEAGIGSVLFWSSMAVSLSIGFFAAYPVNLALLSLGVKEGMSNPKTGGASH